MTEQFNIDSKIAEFNKQVYNSPLIQDVWKKYYWKGAQESTPRDVYDRVANAIANSAAEHLDTAEGTLQSEVAQQVFNELMSKRLFLPGGRILAGAGTNKRVTLMNCYVNGTLDDSILGIAEGKKNLLVTSSMGGGVGTDFSPLRPFDALIGDLDSGSASSGAVSFMDTFNADGKTIRSAGERRAAQMGTISDTHPDLPAFIKAKGEGLKNGSMRLAEFNVSVLVSDAFMAAAAEDEEWLLYFHIPPRRVRDPELLSRDFIDDNGIKQYVYEIWNARELWKLITEYTYEFSDPGVIFIDRINELNNLQYCETIRCTNPCGEQPLPPHGTCNLGAINVANCCIQPFTKGAAIDYELLANVARWGVRFLDNVIDVTAYPLQEQQNEEFSKRRIGLGILGLGTLFAELGLKYGSAESVVIAEKVMKTIALSAYQASIDLAKERGSFPLFQPEIIDKGFINERLPEELQDQIVEVGLRNGVILTIAPVGTGSIAFGNVSSGLEPDFDHAYERRVRKNNTEEYDTYTEMSYTKRFYEFVTGNADTPDYMVTAQNIEIIDHIKIQGACQKWVDASVSKTINIPEDMPYERFVEVYELAYLYGCKGCTTYRPSKWRGSILTTVGDKDTNEAKTSEGRSFIIGSGINRPEILSGNTYKVKWPSLSSSMFVTINYDEVGHPFEIFFASKDAKFQDWMTGLTLMISGILRSGIDPAFIPYELKQVVSTHDTGFYNKKFYGSLVARVGDVIEQDFIRHGIIKTDGASLFTNQSTTVPSEWNNPLAPSNRSRCPKCNQPTLIHKEGCEDCTSCGFSKCF